MRVKFRSVHLYIYQIQLSEPQVSGDCLPYLSQGGYFEKQFFQAVVQITEVEDWMTASTLF